jgi:transposase InsO family protein
VTVFTFVEREKACHRVTTMCRMLGVSASGYWAWRRRAPSLRQRTDAELAAHIREAHVASRGVYGAPRIHAELRAAGVRCGRKRIARVMRRDCLVGVHRRRFAHTTLRDGRRLMKPDEQCPPQRPLPRRGQPSPTPSRKATSNCLGVETELDPFRGGAHGFLQSRGHRIPVC